MLSRLHFQACVLLALGLVANSTQRVVAQEQHLHGKTFPPFSEERRDKAFQDLRERRIARDKSQFGARNGLLANELQSQLSPGMFDRDAASAEALLAEWCTAYSSSPPGSQHWLARHALYIARMMRIQAYSDGSSVCMSVMTDHSHPEPKPKLARISDKIVTIVIAAARSNNWLLSADLKSELQQVASDSHIDDSLKRQARAVLERPAPKMERQFEQRLIEATKTADRCIAVAGSRKLAVPYKGHGLSWWPAFERANRRPNGTLIEPVGDQFIHSVQIKVLPLNSCKDLSRQINRLSDDYLKLPSASQEIFAGRLLLLLSKLQGSNVHCVVEPAFWKVFDTLDETWLTTNEVTTALGHNSPYYAQTYRLDKAIKITKKEIAMEDFAYGGIPSNSNLRWVLGDLYDENHEYARSKEQYKIAAQIDERLVESGILEAGRFMDRDYEIRLGTYKPRPD